jgi:hypothetical protein
LNIEKPVIILKKYNRISALCQELVVLKNYPGTVRLDNPQYLKYCALAFYKYLKTKAQKKILI